jgi:hypothetical protein
VLAVLIKVGDAVSREEGWCRPGRGGFFRNGLGAAFTKLGRMPVTGIWIRPRAAHAVEAFGLIELEQRPRGPPRAHLLQRTFQRYGYAGDSGSMVVRLRYGELGLVGLTESAHTHSIHRLRLSRPI